MRASTKYSIAGADVIINVPLRSFGSLDWRRSADLIKEGYAAAEAYLPSQKIAIAVATTFAPEAFNEQGDYSNAAEELFRKIGAEMAPDDAPPMPPPK